MEPKGSLLLLTYLLTYLRNYLLTYSKEQVLLEKLTSFQLVKKFPTFYGTRSFITVTYLLTYLLTPCSTVLLEKLTSFQLVKKFPAFYGTRRFITAFKSASHLSLSWASSIKSTPPHPTLFLLLSSHLRLGLPSGLFPSGFPTKTLYTPTLCPTCATCPAQLILLYFFYWRNSPSPCGSWPPHSRGF